jgi:Tfp pilus assembly protein PilO
MKMKVRKLSTREKMILYITLGLIVFALLFNFAISPLQDRLTEVNKEIEKKSFLLKRQSSLMQRGENILSLYERYRHALEEQEDPEEIVADLFKKIEAQATASGITVRKVKPLPVKENKGYKEVLIEIDLEGDFTAIFKFIVQLESDSPLIKIVSLRLVPQSSSSRVLRSRLNLSQIFF